jgi:hypothetical protein
MVPFGPPYCTVNRRALIQWGRIAGELPPLPPQPKPQRRPRAKKPSPLRPVFWAHAARPLGIEDIAVAPAEVQAALMYGWPADRLFPVWAIPYARPWQIWPRRSGSPPLLAHAWLAKFYHGHRGGSVAFKADSLHASVTPLRSAGDPDTKRRASLRRLLGLPPLAGDVVTTLPTPSAKEVNAFIRTGGAFEWLDDPYALDYEEAELAAQQRREALAVEAYRPKREMVDSPLPPPCSAVCGCVEGFCEHARLNLRGRLREKSEWREPRDDIQESFAASVAMPIGGRVKTFDRDRWGELLFSPRSAPRHLDRYTLQRELSYLPNYGGQRAQPKEPYAQKGGVWIDDRRNATPWWGMWSEELDFRWPVPAMLNAQWLELEYPKGFPWGKWDENRCFRWRVSPTMATLMPVTAATPAASSAPTGPVAGSIFGTGLYAERADIQTAEPLSLASAWRRKYATPAAIIDAIKASVSPELWWRKPGPTPAEKPPKRSVGRPRKHANRAARQAAWRARKNAREAAE